MNIKKLFPESKVTRKKLLDFFDKKGFYLVLILCIVIVGVTAYFVMVHNIDSSNAGLSIQKSAMEELGDSVQTSADDKNAVQSAISTDSPQKVVAVADADKSAAQDQAKSAATQAAASPSPKAQAPANAPKLAMPVFGNSIVEFAQDKLVYSKTLEEWRAHSGIDIAADRGTTVKAAADGTVESIKSDPRLGITITLSHGNGYKTVYANLASDDMVVVNQILKQGDVLGCVGNTAVFEQADAAHLHFEVLKNDAPVDPTVMLPKAQ